MKKDKKQSKFEIIDVDVKEYFLEKFDDLYIQALAQMPEDPTAKSYTSEEIDDLFDEIRGK